MTITLRDYQQRASAEIREAYAYGRRAPLLVSPTGSGKTVLFAYIAQNAAKRGNNVLILVHRKELLNQTARTLESLGVDHGLIAPGMPFQGALVQVASIQTLVRRADRIRWAPKLIIVDEAHHATAKSSWGRVLKYYSAASLLGVTATPERLDGRGLGVESDGFFDAIVQGPTVADLIGKGYLSPPVVYAPSTVDLSGVHTRMGDFVRAENEAATDKPKITGSAVAHYRKHSHNEPALVFCCSIKHAEHVAEEFAADGYQAASIDGTLDDRARRRRIEDLGAGRLNVLTSCEIVSEGTDIPVVSAAILLRPTQSMGLYLQQVGRSLRPFSGKIRAMILDHVGNCFRHGLPDDDREWTLEGKRRNTRKNAENSLPVRQCERCYHAHRPAPVCPKCGFRYAIKVREIEQIDGELEQVKMDQIRIASKQEQRKARSLEDLREIAKKRGYKRGWAEYVYAARNRNSPRPRRNPA